MAHINESLINIQFTLNLADTPALTHAYSLSYLLNGGGGGGVGGCSGNVQGNNSIRVATIRSLQNKPPLDRGALPPPIEDFFYRKGESPPFTRPLERVRMGGSQGRPLNLTDKRNRI